MHTVGNGCTGGVEQTVLAEVSGGGAGKVMVVVGLGNTNWLCTFQEARQIESGLRPSQWD